MKDCRVNTRTFCLLIVLALFVTSGICCFLIKCGAGPGYYINKLFSMPVDTILTSIRYVELVDEYYCLNNKYKDETVVVFVGDSITERFNINEYFKSGNLINRGIPSDTTYGLFNRLNTNICNLQIGKLFLMIGYNDLQFRSNDEIILNINKILKNITAKSIYVQSLLPVSIDKPEENTRIVMVNQMLKQIADENGVVFIDIFTPFLGNDGNGINPAMTGDGIHPNGEGYRLWANILKFDLGIMTVAGEPLLYD